MVQSLAESGNRGVRRDLLPTRSLFLPSDHRVSFPRKLDPQAYAVPLLCLA